MKNKNLAGVLALLFGMFGVHRFYLNQRFIGALYFIGGIFSIIITAEESFPLVLFPAALALVDSILFFAMPQRDFDRRYNHETANHSWAGRFRQKRSTDRFPRYRNRYHSSELDVLREDALANFRSGYFAAAAERFEQALSIEPLDPMLHYNLAATYAMMEDESLAFSHLDESVRLGFDNWDKIHTHDALAYLRSFPAFDTFVQNGYRLPAKGLMLGQEEALELPPLTKEQDKKREPVRDKLLDQLSELAQLREKGILTLEEFEQQKAKMINSRS